MEKVLAKVDLALSELEDGVARYRGESTFAVFMAKGIIKDLRDLKEIIQAEIAHKKPTA